MKRSIWLVVLALIFFSMTLTGVIAQDTNEAFLRFVHVIPGVTAFDIYTDGHLTISGLEYGSASNYIKLPAGAYTITVRSSGLTATLWQQQVSVGVGEAKTLIASNIDPLSFDVYNDDFQVLDTGTTRLRIIHAIQNGEPVDVFYGSDPVASNMAYRDTVGTFDLPANTYPLTALYTSGAGAIFEDTAFSLTSSTSHILVLYGTPAIPGTLLLTAPTNGNPGSGALRIAHGVAGGENITFYANNTLLVPSLAFGEITEHLVLPEGTYTLTANLANAISETPVTIDSGSAQIVVIMGTPNALTLGVYNDAMQDVANTVAVISVVNAMGEGSTASVSLADGTILADSLGYGDAPVITTLQPAAQDLIFVPNISGQSATFELDTYRFYGGTYYNIVAVGGTLLSAPTVIVASTSIDQGIASAPGASAVAVVDTPPLPDVPTAETEISTTEISTEVVQAPVVTEEPVPTQQVLPPGVPEAPPLPTARVVLNPGANLQLRQYPNAESLSLGLAPSGSILTVNGREGAPVDIDGNEIPIGETEEDEPIYFVDPAVNLDPEDEKADIVPVETWLNISYTTPDGGEVTAWVNALYLDVRDVRNKQQRLVELPMIPGNRYGQARNTAITAPEPTENIITTRVINLNVGANLNLRRTPVTDGEVLARLPLGTVTELIGMGQSGNWAFVLFAPSEGGYISGWVSTQYLTYALNGQDIKLETLQERALIHMVDEEVRRGEVSANAPSVAAPVQNPTRNAYVAEVIINPDANLNLRRNPDAQSEVVVPIPSGTQLIIEGRTEDGLWLRTSFENQTGWVASAYVYITYNGTTVELEEIPVILPPSPADEDDENGEGENEG